MKKFFVLTIALAMLLSIASFADFDYAHYVASDNDPYATYKFDETIDTSKVTWAAIKYRTITKADSTGVDLIGQIYIDPAAEPFCPVKWNHTQEWETIIVDLTAVSESTTLTEIWTTAAGTGFRLDPMESNRDAEANVGTDLDDAKVQEGDSIDIAYIAFFETKEAAEKFDGTNGAVALFTAADLADVSGTRFSVETMTEKEAAAPAPEAGTTETPSTGAAQTADVISLAAAAAVLALGAVVISKKR